MVDPGARHSHSDCPRGLKETLNRLRNIVSRAQVQYNTLQQASTTDTRYRWLTSGVSPFEGLLGFHIVCVIEIVSNIPYDTTPLHLYVSLLSFHRVRQRYMKRRTLLGL